MGPRAWPSANKEKFDLKFFLKKDKKPPPVKLNHYGDLLATNKAKLFRSLGSSRLKLSDQEKCLLAAVAMLETQHMDLSERDSKKDGTPAANVSIFNMNIYMLRQLGYRGKNEGAHLNTERGLPVAVKWATLAIRTWGAKRFLDFHRGGRTGFTDGVSYDCQSYRNSINTMLPMLMKDKALASSNDMRIDVYVIGV